MAIIVFIIILSLLVMIHELGHFLMAKRAKIGVEEFGFGLPPRLWGKKIGETIYSINWLPFGGFVRLVGEDSVSQKAQPKNSFQTKTILQRSLVVVAGVGMNLLLAVIIFYVVLFALGFKVSLPLLVEHKFMFADQSRQVLVMEVAGGSQADKAGMKMGESILAVDGVQIDSTTQLQNIIRSSGDKMLAITLENPVNNMQRMVEAMPKYNDQTKTAVLGIGLGELGVLKYETFGQKLFSGFTHSYNITVYSVKVFAQLVGFALKEHNIAPVSEGVSGPVGIAQITSQAVSLGFLSVLQLVGLLSLNLALINILPIPALDGGRFFFIIIEAVTKKRVNPKFEKWAHSIGFAVLLGLIVLVTFNDIIKLFR